MQIIGFKIIHFTNIATKIPNREQNTMFVCTPWIKFVPAKEHDQTIGPLIFDELNLWKHANHFLPAIRQLAKCNPVFLAHRVGNLSASVLDKILREIKRSITRIMVNSLNRGFRFL